MIPARVAVVDDEPRMARVLSMVLSRDGHEVTTWTAPEDFLGALEAGEEVDLLLTDLKMPGMDGVTLLEQARGLRPELPVLLITAHGTVTTAIEAMKKGAYDYLPKPVDNDACRMAVRRALDHTRLARENRRLRQELQGRLGLDGVVAESPAMQRVLDLATRAARSEATVLITGESGTGKEVLARVIHLRSERVGGPFEAVNCKALSAGVLESELFGHERGAFTGAERARAGLFERAQGGTVLLDELGEVDLDFQGKLLRVLQEGEVRRVGGDAPRRVDARVIAATNRDLGADIASGRFREDLYYRLAVVPIHLPPLRERREDILPLARLFLERAARQMRRSMEGWGPEVESWLLNQDWPGNVRELENCVERGVVLARDARVRVEDLQLLPGRAAPKGSLAEREEPLHVFLDRMTEQRVRQALADAEGVRVEAARLLGVERTTLYRLIKRFAL